MASYISEERWHKALERGRTLYLRAQERESSGDMAMVVMVVFPLMGRYMDGERSQSLYDALMGLVV